MKIISIRNSLISYICMYRISNLLLSLKAIKWRVIERMLAYKNREHKKNDEDGFTKKILRRHPRERKKGCTDTGTYHCRSSGATRCWPNGVWARSGTGCSQIYSFYFSRCRCDQNTLESQRRPGLREEPSMATSQSKNSTRSKYREHQAGVLPATINGGFWRRLRQGLMSGLPDLPRPMDASGKNTLGAGLRRRTRLQLSFSSSWTLSLNALSLIGNLTSRLEIIRLLYFTEFCRFRQRSDRHLRNAPGVSHASRLSLSKGCRKSQRPAGDGAARLFLSA